MKSELWQRLRAARRYADLRQRDVANACAVDRSAVAQWESLIEKNRTHPDHNQISIIARLAKLPVQWLMDDTVEPESVWQVGREYGQLKVPPPPRGGQVTPPVAEQEDLFPRAVEFDAYMRAPQLRGLFSDGGASFLKDGFAVALASWSEHWHRHAARLMAQERRSGAQLKMHLILWSPGPVDTTGFQDYPITVTLVHSPAEAVDYLLKLTR